MSIIYWRVHIRVQAQNYAHLCTHFQGFLFACLI